MGFLSNLRKERRPITRRFWLAIRYMPSFIRKRFIRAQFDVEHNLPESIVIKPAETEDELKQVFKLVHDSYVELGYMDQENHEMRFSKFMALPTTLILVAKNNEEVIGTISFVMDSALGLPCEMTWNIDHLRKDGSIICEVSGLTIKKSFKMRRGRLFLAICKATFEFGRKVLAADQLVIATTVEVEPFYTDILCFEKVVERTGQHHAMVKGNPSTCCSRDLRTVDQAYKENYQGQDLKNNIGHYILYTEVPNIQIPEKKYSLPAYLAQKNRNVQKLMNDISELKSNFSNLDKVVLNKLNPIQDSHLEADMTGKKPTTRITLTEAEVWAYTFVSRTPIQVRVIDVAPRGIQFQILENDHLVKQEDMISIVIRFNGEIISCAGIVRWKKINKRVGIEITHETREEWHKFFDQVQGELFDLTETINHKVARSLIRKA